MWNYLEKLYAKEKQQWQEVLREDLENCINEFLPHGKYGKEILDEYHKLMDEKEHKDIVEYIKYP